MKERRAEVSPEQKLGWYYRYWKSMQLSENETPTYIDSEWDTYIANDPLFNKKKAKKVPI